MSRHPRLLTLLLALCLLVIPQSANALTFEFQDGPGMLALAKSDPAKHTQIRTGLVAAGKLWTDRIATNVNIVVTVDWKPLGTSIATSDNVSTTTSYILYRPYIAAKADPRSATDTAVLKTLPTGNPSFVVRNPGASISNSSLTVPRAVLKALGIVPAKHIARDGGLAINSSYAYDFNSADGVAAGEYDFVSIAAHELMHILGAVTIVDAIDARGSGSFTPMMQDLFRWSVGADGKPVRDLSADATAKFFSPDGKPTSYTFCRGKRSDGKTADHWESATTGMMVAQVGKGQRLVVSEADLAMLDAMGWNLVR